MLRQPILELNNKPIQGGLRRGRAPALDAVRRVKPTLAALAAVPGYLTWKLPLYSGFITHREKRWVKTVCD